MYFDLRSANYLKDLIIQVEFEDGNKGEIDFSPYLKRGLIFERFRDRQFFSQFRVEDGTLVWGDNELDIAPETLYEKATGKTINLLRNKNLVEK